MWQNFLLLNSDRRGEACLDASILFPGMTFPIRSLPGSHHRVAPRALLLYLAAPSMICYLAQHSPLSAAGFVAALGVAVLMQIKAVGWGPTSPALICWHPQKSQFVCGCWQRGHPISQSHTGHSDGSKVERFINIPMP